MSNEQSTTTPEEQPPILGTWKRLYIFVLIIHALIITLFYIFTTIFK